jgi:hypothetical protein
VLATSITARLVVLEPDLGGSPRGPRLIVTRSDQPDLDGVERSKIVQRLEAIVVAPGSPQNHVWRARIILLSGDGST